MRTNNRIRRAGIGQLLVATSIATLGWGAPAFGQGATPAEATDNTGLEDIVVTARSRAEDLFEAPLSITGFSAADLERTNLNDISSLAQSSPGFYYTPQATFTGSRVAPAYRFRGLNASTNTPIQQLGGAFIDGVYLFGGVQSLTFDDVERVEVIKGPQSALFGRGTFAGAINFITREPADKLAIRGSMGIETRGTHQISLSVEAPLSDQVTFRLSGATNQKGAHFRTNDGGELGRERNHAVNAQLVWKPIDGLRFRLRHSEAWQDDSHHGVVFMNANRSDLVNAPNRCRRGPTQFFWCGQVPTLNSPNVPDKVISVSTSLVPPAFAGLTNQNIVLDILNNNLASPLVINGLPYITKTPHLDHAGLAGRFTRTSFEAGYEFENGMAINFVAATSESRSTSANSASDDTGNGYNISTNILQDKSADIRLSSNQESRFTWLVGANYFKQKSLGGDGGTGATVQAAAPFTNPTGPRVITYTEPPVYANQVQLESYSFFGAAGFEITDGLSIDVEGRYVIDKVTSSLGLTTQTTATFKNFTPRAILTFQPSDGLTIYASWARAALPGTTNSNTALLSPALAATVRAYPGYSDSVPDETLDNYEVGIKQKLGWIRYALTGYHMKWDNLKNVAFTQCPGFVLCGPTLFAPFVPTVLAQKAKIWGVEGEIDAAVMEGWNISLNGSYTRAKYDEYFAPLAINATGQTDASGKTIFGFPSLQGTFNTNHTGPIGGEWDAFVNGEAIYTGKMYVDEINQSYVGDWVKLNLRVGVQKPGLRLEAYVENLTNSKQWLSAARANQTFYGAGPLSGSQTVGAAVLLPRLRTFGVRASFTFD